jgi:general stress protein 26
MATDKELEQKFWKELEGSPFVMLAFADARDSEVRPMTAKLEGQRIWFFGSRSDDLVGETEAPRAALATFTSKGHDLFAVIRGTLVPETDPKAIDRLWDSSTAAWYPKGREDPGIALVRFDTDRAELWNAAGTSLAKSVYRRLTGGDPREAAQEEKAEVTLND